MHVGGGAIHKLINRENVIFKEGHDMPAWFLKSGDMFCCFLMELDVLLA